MNRILSRRNIVQAGAMSAVAAVAHAQQDPGPQRVELFAEGIIPVGPWPFIAPPPPLPPEIIQEINAGRLEGRLRVTYPAQGNVILLQVYFAWPYSPLGPAQDPPYTTPPTGTLVEIRPQRVIVTRSPNTILVDGVVCEDRVVAPYGPFRGRAAAISLEYEGEGRTRFNMLAATVVGSHTASCPTAVGTLTIRGNA